MMMMIRTQHRHCRKIWRNADGNRDSRLEAIFISLACDTCCARGPRDNEVKIERTRRHVSVRCNDRVVLKLNKEDSSDRKVRDLVGFP